MTTDHWFDQLNRAFVKSAPRRGVLGAIGLMLAGGAGHSSGAAAPKRKRKRKRKRRPTGKPRRSCSRGVCNREWRPKGERRSCEATCRRCKRTKTSFCIQKFDTIKIADCCDPGEPCCNGKCCPHWESADGPVPSKCCGKECCPETWDCCGLLCCPPGECCDAGNVKFCLPAETICCPDEAETRVCKKTEYCCPGVGCVADQQACACATGGECPDDDCADGRPRCNGQCCPTGLECINGSCRCGPICNDWRGPRCCPPGERCFGDGQDQACCPSDYIEPPCPFNQAGYVCVPDVPYVCCEGHFHARTPPEDYLCYGRVPTGGVSPGTDCGDHPECYPPIAIYRPS